MNLTFTIEDLAQAFTAGVVLGQRKQQPRPHFDWRVEFKQKPIKEPRMLTLNITNEQQVTVHLAPKTAAGRPAKLDGTPEWSLVSGNCTLKASDDGLSCTIVSGDELGTSEVSVKADADIGEGVEEIADFVEVVVGGAKATSLGLSADAPEVKPEA